MRLSIDVGPRMASQWQLARALNAQQNAAAAQVLRPRGWVRIGMSRKASFDGKLSLLPRMTMQRIARARVQTTAGSFAEDPRCKPLVNPAYGKAPPRKKGLRR